MTREDLKRELAATLLLLDRNTYAAMQEARTRLEQIVAQMGQRS